MQATRWPTTPPQLNSMLTTWPPATKVPTSLFMGVCKSHKLLFILFLLNPLVDVTVNSVKYSLVSFFPPSSLCSANVADCVTSVHHKVIISL